MPDGRVTVEANGEHGRVRGTDGEVAVGGATFRFSVGGPDGETDDGTDVEDGDGDSNPGAPGGGAIVPDSEPVCPEHGARFGCGDGFRTAGPRRGDELAEIDVTVRNGTGYLTDERVEAGRPIER